MSLHVLLVVNTYRTPENDQPAPQLPIHLRAYEAAGIRAGLVAVAQRGRTLLECLRNRALLTERTEHGAVVVEDCLHHRALARLPYLRSPARPEGAFARHAMLRGIERYVARHGRPDLIHAHSTIWAGYAARAAAARHALPYVVTEHWTVFHTDAVAPRIDAVTREVLRDAHACLPVSQATGRALERRYGAAARPWTAIPNPLHERRFRPETLPAHGITLITCAALQPRKRIDLLLFAFARAFPDGATELRICGDGPERRRLERLARTLGVAERVTFSGWLTQPEIARALHNAHLYVCTSDVETFGIAVMEALACGRPVIATRCGGPDDMIGPDNGVLVPTGDETTLTRAMRETTSTLERFDPHAIAAAAHARYAPERVIERLRPIYLDAIERRARP